MKARTLTNYSRLHLQSNQKNQSAKLVQSTRSLSQPDPIIKPKIKLKEIKPAILHENLDLDRTPVFTGSPSERHL